MGRQYLNVLFTPTVAFKGHTEGLCGVMDNDLSNDLRGSNGKQYSDPIKFAESCKWAFMFYCIFKVLNKTIRPM